MITLTSNDGLSFSVYGHNLTRDSKRFLLQSKYQSLDSTISLFNGKLLSFYVDFINIGEVTLDKQYEKELLSLADYMQSIAFLHEVEWQFKYMCMAQYYTKYDTNDRGALYAIFSIGERDDDKLQQKSLFRSISQYLLYMRVRGVDNVMHQFHSCVNEGLLGELKVSHSISLGLYHCDRLVDCFKTCYMYDETVFKAVYGDVNVTDNKTDKDCNYDLYVTEMNRRVRDYELTQI